MKLNVHLQSVMRVLVYIEEHLDEPMNLEHLAKIAHISPFHFHRIFRALMGETLHSYIQRLRLEYARGALHLSQKSITEICLESGYENHSAFTKMFKQLIGISPQAYRKRMQPYVENMLKQTQATKPQWINQVQYVDRKEEEVLFIRRLGDYQHTPFEAFKDLFAFLEKEKKLEKVKAFYGLGLDDSQIVEKGKLRFDACVSLKDPMIPSGEVGKKKLPACHCAVFIFQGPYHQIENAILDIFRYWYPDCQKELSPLQPICECLDFLKHNLDRSEGSTKIYIPLLG